MDNVNVLLFVESRYRVDRKRIAASIVNLLKKQKVTSSLEVSVAIVGDRKMKGLNGKFRGKQGTTNILTFPLQEGEDFHVPKDILRLGDIVLSYPQIVKESAKDNMLVDDKIDDLMEHGMLHLLGIHHEE